MEVYLRKGKRVSNASVWANDYENSFTKLDDAVRVLREELTGFKRSAIAAQAATNQRISQMGCSGGGSGQPFGHHEHEFLKGVKVKNLAFDGTVITSTLWQEFLDALVLRFGSSLYEHPSAALKDIKHITTVEDYQARFEELSTKVQDIPEAWLISSILMPTISLLSVNKSRSTTSASLLLLGSYAKLLSEGAPISTGTTASCPKVRLKGISSVEVWGVGPTSC
ncbi:uncharacterized protein G2W53_000400 [Senna tora]|uniref:Retrotransposon gag domain-containing protein n=1 Tax=Senna tora TaxID=362788 RepID=A0A835CKJ6_9FABA|nr:uncharacterized protein G2W53_000400 [Senna tora]